MAVRSFAELSEEFLRLHVATKRKARTGAGYERLLALYILPAIGSRRLTDIRRSDVARLHAGLSDRPYTANRVVALISAIWNWASRRDEVAFEANPARGVERNPESGKERFLSADEMARLGDVMRRGETEGLAWDVDETKPTAKHVQKDGRVIVIDHHAVAAIRLRTSLTGARLREILTAKWSYLDFERGIMFLPDLKTGKKPIYLSAAALAVLDAIPRMNGNPYIIPGAERVHHAMISIGDGCKSQRPLGWDGVRLHDLRHSFASTGAGASLGLPIIGKLLGHSQPATTARYSHLDADPMRRAADIIGNQIAAAMAGKSADVVPLPVRVKK